jgi:hypothetical protein
MAVPERRRAPHLEGDALQRLSGGVDEVEPMAARPRRPAHPLAGADPAPVEAPRAALAFEGDALRRRRNVGIDREDAAVARAGDAVALAARTSPVARCSARSLPARKYSSRAGSRCESKATRWATTPTGRAGPRDGAPACR